MQITLEGIDALKQALQNTPDLARAHVSDVVARTAFAVASRARSLAPVETGALRSAITHTARGLSGRIGLSAGMISGRRPEIYWRFIEYGTVKTSARSMFRTAAEAEATIIPQRLRDASSRIERDWTAGRAL